MVVPFVKFVKNFPDFWWVHLLLAELSDPLIINPLSTLDSNYSGCALLTLTCIIIYWNLNNVCCLCLMKSTYKNQHIGRGYGSRMSKYEKNLDTSAYAWRGRFALYSKYQLVQIRLRFRLRPWKLYSYIYFVPSSLCTTMDALCTEYANIRYS